MLALTSRQQSFVKVLLSLFTVGILYFLVRDRPDLNAEAFKAAVAKFHAPNAALVALLGAGQIAFMILRLWALDPVRPRVALKQVASIVAIGHAVNMFFPARAGEALKMYWLGRAGGMDDGHLARGAGWIAADRIADLIAFASMILLTGVFNLPEFRKTLPFHPGWFAAGPIVLGLAAIAFGRISPKARGTFHVWVLRLRSGLSGIVRPAAFAGAWIAAVLAWVVEMIAIGILARSQGFSLDHTQLFFVLVVLNLAIAVPVSMANVGTFEASVAFALGFFGVPLTVGVAIGTAHHLLQLVGIAGWALAALAWRRNSSAASSSGPSA